MISNLKVNATESKYNLPQRLLPFYPACTNLPQLEGNSLIIQAFYGA